MDGQEAEGARIAVESLTAGLLWMLNLSALVWAWFVVQMGPLRLWAQGNEFIVDVLTVNILLILLIVSVRLDQRRRRQKVLQQLGLGMAKWKKGYLADILAEALFKAAEEGKLSRQVARHLSIEIGKLFGLEDLLPRRHNPKAIQYRIRKNVEIMEKQLALSNPKIPGGIAKSGEVPLFVDEGLGFDFLAKRKAG